MKLHLYVQGGPCGEVENPRQGLLRPGFKPSPHPDLLAEGPGTSPFPSVDLTVLVCTQGPVHAISSVVRPHAAA